MKKVVLIILAGLVLFLTSCVSRRATLKTFIDPSLEPTQVTSVGVFQMRNAAFSPGETLEMDRLVTQAFSQKNPGVKLVGSSESNRVLNSASLTEEYTDFLEDFESSGIPNTNFLNTLKEVAGFDAILQGRLSEVRQEDRQRSAYGQRPSKTTLTVRYTLLSTMNGKIIWEGMSNGGIITRKKFGPPIYEVVYMAQDKILTSLPILGN